ncbi:hypothetical protein Bp8pS_129 [Bacillus phage vB_BpuM-BpSp]|nr:hypothetical protein Bp8pS_129 [Bacillus phage vB_BpuM-BpSp]
MSNSTVKGWEDKINWEDRSSLDDNNASSITVAPEEPVKIVKDSETGLVKKFIFGNMKRIEEGEAAVLWSQELIRDENNAVTGILTTRANGVQTLEKFIRENGEFIGTELEYLEGGGS